MFDKGFPLLNNRNNQNDNRKIDLKPTFTLIIKLGKRKVKKKMTLKSIFLERSDLIGIIQKR